MRFMSRQIPTSSVPGVCRSVWGHFRRRAAGDLASRTKESSSVTVSAQKLHVTAKSNTTVRGDDENTSTSIRQKTASVTLAHIHVHKLIRAADRRDWYSSRTTALWSCYGSGPSLKSPFLLRAISPTQLLQEHFDLMSFSQRGTQHIFNQRTWSLTESILEWTLQQRGSDSELRMNPMEESNMKVTKSTSSRASTRVQYCGTGPECSKHTTSFILKELITTRTNKKDSCQHLATSTIKLTNHSLHHQRGCTTSTPSFWHKMDPELCLQETSSQEPNIPGWSRAGAFVTHHFHLWLPLCVFPVISPPRLFKKADRLKQSHLVRHEQVTSRNLLTCHFVICTQTQTSCSVTDHWARVIVTTRPSNTEI